MRNHNDLYAISILNLLSEHEFEGTDEKEVRSHLNYWINNTAEGLGEKAYNNLVRDVSSKYVKLMDIVHREEDEDTIVQEATKELNEIAKSYLNEDFYEMTSSELESLGFGVWSGNLHLIPIYLLKLFGAEDPVISITGTVGKVKSIGEPDVRMGCIPYGIETTRIDNI